MESSLAVRNPEIEQKVGMVPARAREMKVTDGQSYAAAGEVLKMIKAYRKEIDSYFDPIVERAHRAHKEAVAQKKRMEGPLVEAEMDLKRKMSLWTTQEEQRRRQEEMAAQEKARKFAEDQQLAEAAALEQAGDKHAAEQVISQPVVAPTVILPGNTPKVAGVSTRKVWKFEVTNEELLPRHYMLPDEKKIGAVVRAMGVKTNIPGIKVWCEDVISSGSV